MADEPRKERALRDPAAALELERLAAARVERNRAVHEALRWGGEMPPPPPPFRYIRGEPVPAVQWRQPSDPSRYPPLRVRLGWGWIEVKHRLSHAWDALRGRDCGR